MRGYFYLLAFFGLGACSVGPDFSRPAARLPATWAAEPREVRSNAATRAIDAHWWRQFNDPLLSELVERAAQANFDVRTANERLLQSRAARQIAGAEQLPGVAADGSYQRQRNSAVGLMDASGHSGKSPFELWNLGLDASWEVDLWGHVRRGLEGAGAAIELSRAQRDGVLLSVAAETATDYLRLRGTQARLEVARQNLDIARQSRDLTQTRYDNGVTTQLDTANAAAQVADIEARLPLLEAQQAHLINALSYLLGEQPGSLSARLLPPAAIPLPPLRVPVGLPSELAQRRPDIQQAEAALHRATAAIGVAEADFYPRVSLGGGFGFQALQGSDIGSWGSRQWSFGPSLYLPIFQGGRLTGTLELREHQQQEAALNYQRTVLAAWHEVDNALTDYSAEQRHHAALEEAVKQNRIALANARQRYKEGAVDFINVLGVQRALIANQSELADSATRVSTNLVQLYKALGGGWPQPAKDS
ncbi:efflux transporter, outer membrane factor lipoprotein, NodT family [Pseudomonas asplenii]|uniref:Efflux transporter, outer membrane factor lipoprotein, NodT family n=1 Tax=Pseudomonas asplenii TaxID=53407 RepID=A0A0M9GIB3_9PSED|nr:efflux transporter outer membrane subunit [Pseudomonas fuscovaginae]KPA91966.1 efflux transporter, outer membrane factor lipoprotein, NodT family [Pseudomonas fuscovaginae]